MPREPLRVFYNASAIPPRPAGAGVYTLELGRALTRLDGVELQVAAAVAPGFGQHIAVPDSRPSRIAWEEVALARCGSLRAADVYHGPHFFVPRTNVPAVATVHDLTFFRIPARYSLGRRLYYRHLAATATRADRIIVPSAAVANDVVRYLQYAPERVRVIAEAPRSWLAPARESAIADFKAKHNISNQYICALGTAEPGKRAVDVIRAMPEVVAAFPDCTLALAGNSGTLSLPLQREAERLGVASSVRFCGYVPDSELAAMLSGAVALVFPSLYEGFGLPPLEAMACGTPVVTTKAPAMNEILSGVALFVPARDPGAIAKQCLQLLRNASVRQEVAAAGLAHASRFSWDRAARETAAVYAEIAS
ncbi:MAG: glycosyltransferase family 1 protein [bacterium]